MRDILIRLTDFMASFAGIVLLFPVIILVMILIYLDIGSPFFTQKRLGCHQKLFTLIKFRTMRKDTPSVASHLVAAGQITRLGSFLRRSKLDELPQLWNVLMGDMSLVGPRPCLPNQQELIHEREAHGIFRVKPGITGLAQIRNIDMSDPVLLVSMESEMLSTFSLYHYFGYILQTISGKGRGDAVK